MPCTTALRYRNKWLKLLILKETDGIRITTVRYADDSQIIVTGPRKKLPEMQRALEKVSDIVNTRFLPNGMMANTSKAEVFLRGNR